MEVVWWKSFQCSRKIVLLVVGLVLLGLCCCATKDQKHHRHHSNHHHEKDVHSTPPLGASAIGLLSGDDSIPVEKHATHGVGRRLDQLITESDHENAPKKDEACLHVRCSPGLVCSSDHSTGLGAVCRCPDERHCQHQHRKGRRVCGSDGRFHDNRCELHRHACFTGEDIRVVRDDDVCRRRKHHVKNNDDEPHSSSSAFSSHSSVTKDHSHSKLSMKRHHLRMNLVASRRRNNIDRPVKENLAPRHQFHGHPSRESSLEGEEQKHVELSGRNRQLSMEKMEEENRDVTTCTMEDLKKMVKGLMSQKCIRSGNKDCDNSTEWRQLAANNLFADLDLNSDLSLELLELNTGEQLDSESVSLLSKVCGLQDLIAFYDLNEDALLSIDEFYSALDILVEDVQLRKTVVVAGTSLELKCSSLNGTGIIWKRNGRTLGDIYNDDIKVLNDGSLYVHEITLSHIGNYSCVDRITHDLIRSHMVQVQVFPIVRVSPLTQFHTSGSTSTLRCHAEGVPRPRLSWDFNESPVPSQPNHYLLLHYNHTLLIKDSQYLQDTGAFKCKAHNAVGTSQDIATVFVENSDVPKYGRVTKGVFMSSDLVTPTRYICQIDASTRHVLATIAMCPCNTMDKMPMDWTLDNIRQLQVEDPYELFLVFHDDGYSVHEPSHCHIQHIVSGTFDAFNFRPDIANDNTIRSLCEPNQTCSWGDAVNVGNKFIYVSQPNLNRIVVIEVRDRFNPVEVIPMDEMPVEVDYIDHLDEVWVLCWNQSQRDGASKASLIIRQASSDIQHHTIHMQHMRNSFAWFSAIYLPPNSVLNHHFRYGYAVDSVNTTTYKVDLVAMKLAHSVNLGCNPISMAFLALGGKVVVNCGSQTPGLLVLDYLTDEVLQMLNVTGDPYVSPDSRFLVTVDNAELKISVYTVSDEGAVEYSFDLSPELMVSDVAFLASDTGYDFFASSSEKNSVLFVDLSTGLFETVEGVGEAPRGEEWPWSRVNRAIVAGGMFSDYLMSPSSEAIVVVDARRRHLQCEWQEMTSHANVIVWTEVSKL